MNNGITPVSDHLVPYSALDKRSNCNDKVESVTVTVVSPTLLKGTKITGEMKPLEAILTFVLCSIGALGLFSYSLSFVNDVITSDPTEMTSL